MQASPFRQVDEYSMTIAHHWNAGEQTIPMRYGRAVEELIRRSSEYESGGRLAHDTSHSTGSLMASVDQLWFYSANVE